VWQYLSHIRQSGTYCYSTWRCPTFRRLAPVLKLHDTQCVCLHPVCWYSSLRSLGPPLWMLPGLRSLCPIIAGTWYSRLRMRRRTLRTLPSMVPIASTTGPATVPAEPTTTATTSLVPRALRSLVPIASTTGPATEPTKPTTTWYPVSTVGTKPTATGRYMATGLYPVGLCLRLVPSAYGCYQRAAVPNLRLVHRAVPIVAMAATKPGTQGCTQSLRLLPSLVPIRLRLPPSLVPMAATKPTTTWYPVSTVGTKPTAARAYQAYSHRYPVCAYGCYQAYGHRSGWLYPVCTYGCYQAYGHRSTATDTYQRSMAHLPWPVHGTQAYIPSTLLWHIPMVCGTCMQSYVAAVPWYSRLRMQHRSFLPYRCYANGTWHMVAYSTGPCGQ